MTIPDAFQNTPDPLEAFQPPEEGAGSSSPLSVQPICTVEVKICPREACLRLSLSLSLFLSLSLSLSLSLFLVRCISERRKPRRRKGKPASVRRRWETRDREVIAEVLRVSSLLPSEIPR